MHTVHLQIPDPTFAAISEAAAARGITVEALLSMHLASDFSAVNIEEGFFTPEVLSAIDAAHAEAKKGGAKTIAQVREERLTKSKAWRAEHPS